MIDMSYFRGKKILLAGGGGFFGSHIASILNQVKCQIFIPRTKDGIDFRKREDCQKYFKKTKPQIVINCAANQGGIGYHEGKQGDLFMDNMLMGMFLLKTAQEEGVEKFVNIIAGCSYPGYLEKNELNEEDYWSGEVHETIFSYGFSRKASAVFGLALKKQFNFNSIHLIMANMYGPGEHFRPDQSKALAGLIKKIYEAKKNNLGEVEIWGTGKPVRDWLYVKDGAEGILLAAANYNKVDPLNIATGVGISVKDLAILIKKIIDYQGKLVYNTNRPDGAMKKTFGIKKMKKELRWLPQTSMEKGIKETIEWFSKNYKYAISH